MPRPGERCRYHAHSEDKRIADNPYASPATKGTASLSDLVSEPVLTGIWFRTHPLPLYSLYVGPASIPVAVVAAIFAAFGHLLPKNRNSTEAMLDYSGRIYCAHTKDKIYFIESRNNGEFQRIIRQFPLSTLKSCELEHENSTSVKFEFDSDEYFTLYFNRSQSEISALESIKQRQNN